MTNEEIKGKEDLIRKLINELLQDEKSHAFSRRELKILEDACGDDKTSLEAQKWVDSTILQCLEVFYMQGHSGCSAGYSNYQLYRLIQHFPLSNLLGTKEEWEETERAKRCIRYRNKRYYSLSKTVFSDGSVEYRDDEAVEYTTDNGKTWYRNTDENFEEITFPYFPHKKRYYLDENGNIVKIEILN